MRLFYNIDTDCFMDENEIKTYYCMEVDEKHEKECSFEHYLECCLVVNNGSLYPIDNYANKLKNRLSKLEITDDTIDEFYNTISILNDLYSFKRKYNK